MPRYAPFRMCQGASVAELLLEEQIAERIGRDAVLVTDESLEDDGILPIVRQGLESSGIDAIVFNRASVGALSNIADDAAAIIKSSKASLVIGCGDAATLGIARAAVMLSSTNQRAFAVFDSSGTTPRGDASALPYVEIPSRNWNPTACVDTSYIVDSRTRRTRTVETGIDVDSILISSAIADALTDKQLSYDLLCNVLIAIEGLHQPDPILTVPLLSSVFCRALAMIDEIADSYANIDSRQIQIIGIDASFGTCRTPPGPGTALSWAVYGRVETEIPWSAAIMLPATVRVLIERNPHFFNTVSQLLGLDPEEQSGTVAIDHIETRMRTLLGMVDVPFRLRDLDIKKSNLEGVVETAAAISGHGTEILGAIIAKTF